MQQHVAFLFSIDNGLRAYLPKAIENQTVQVELLIFPLHEWLLDQAWQAKAIIVDPIHEEDGIQAQDKVHNC